MRLGVRTVSLCVFVSASLGVGGCSHASRVGFTGRLVVQRDTIGDTIVARTVSGSVWGAARSLVPEVSIGKESGDSTYLFGGISALAVAPDGTIYVLDRQAMVIRAYGADGRYQRTIGRRGGGPGELSQPDGMVVLSDGRILVHDPGNGRIQVYAPDGSPLAEWQVVRPGFFSSDGLRRDTLDNVYMPVLADQGGQASFADWRVSLVRIGPDGTPEDTIPAPHRDFKGHSITIRRVQNGKVRASSTFPVPFTPNEMWAFSPEGYFLHAVSTHYRIDLLRAHVPVLRIERDRAPVPVESMEKTATKEGVTRRARGLDPGWHWSGPDIPDHKPPFQSIMVGRHGRIWVWLYMPSREQKNPDYDAKNPASPRTRWVEPTAFDVFKPNGTYLGRARAPSDFDIYPSVFDGDRVWAVTRDSLGVERVVRYRVAAHRAGPS